MLSSGVIPTNKPIIQTAKKTLDFSEDSAFIQAVARGDIKQVMSLMNSLCDYNQLAPHIKIEFFNLRSKPLELTPLMIAAILGDEKLFDYLRAQGASLTDCDKKGRNLLQIVAHYGLKAEFIEYLYRLSLISNDSPLLAEFEKNKLNLLKHAVVSGNVDNFRAFWRLFQIDPSLKTANLAAELIRLAAARSTVHMVGEICRVFKQFYPLMITGTPNTGLDNLLMAAAQGTKEVFFNICNLFRGLLPRATRTFDWQRIFNSQKTHLNELGENLLLVASHNCKKSALDIVPEVVKLFPESERAQLFVHKNKQGVSVMTEMYSSEMSKKLMTLATTIVANTAPAHHNTNAWNELAITVANKALRSITTPTPAAPSALKILSFEASSRYGVAPGCETLSGAKSVRAPTSKEELVLSVLAARTIDPKGPLGKMPQLANSEEDWLKMTKSSEMTIQSAKKRRRH